ncbi:MAG: LuxR C-terminal-related transcriptional regulator [Gaiellaceae bacterium]
MTDPGSIDGLPAATAQALAGLLAGEHDLLALGAALERAGFDLGAREPAVASVSERLGRPLGDVVAHARLRHRQLLVERPNANELATYEALVTEAAAVERADPGLASRMYGDAAVFAASSDAGASVAAARRSRALAEQARPGTDALPYARLAFASAALANGDPGPAREMVDAGLNEIGDADGAIAVRTLHVFSALFYYLEDYSSARRVLERALAIARRDAGQPALSVVLDTLAAIDIRLGRYASAYGKSLEALRVARAEGDTTHAASCLTTLAAVDAIQGRERECRARAREAAALVPGDHLVHTWALTSLAMLELGLGRVGNVVALAPRVDAAFAGLGAQPANEVVWLNLLVEACVRLGRDGEAADALQRLARAADGLGVGWLAVTARCRALVADGTEAFDWYDIALERHLVSPRPFERARTELCYGELLRRSRRRKDARRLLESALAAFEQLRAAPWSERTRRELAAAGGSPRRAAPAGALTARERQVASLVTGGATNRETAAALFVTTKTVERHLTSVYAKTGVRSRTELTRAYLG